MKEVEVISESTLSFIDHVVNKTQKKTKKELIPEVSRELVEKFGESRGLEFHLQNYRLQTTADIERAIDCYFIARELFPTKKFRQLHCVAS